MTHCTHRSRVRAGHQTVTGPVTPTCSWDRWGRAETRRTALGEALVLRRRTRVRFPPPPPPLYVRRPRADDARTGAYHVRFKKPGSSRLGDLRLPGTGEIAVGDAGTRVA